MSELGRAHAQNLPLLMSMNAPVQSIPLFGHFDQKNVSHEWVKIFSYLLLETIRSNQANLFRNLYTKLHYIIKYLSD